MNIIFLDIDGVLNCQTYYASEAFKKQDEHPYNQICKERVEWLNELCRETNARVVISSTWRMSGLEYCKDTLEECGATFEIIGATPVSNHRVRGVEIQEWLQENIFKLLGKHYFDFYSYAIIDDDSDMLLGQQYNFFQTDNYSGLTPNTCYKIKRFFTKRTFPL